MAAPDHPAPCPLNHYHYEIGSGETIPECQCPKDFFGNSLFLGDLVAFMHPRYRNLELGEIVKFTPCAVRVSFKRGGRETFLQGSRQLIKDTRTSFLRKHPILTAKILP